MVNTTIQGLSDSLALIQAFKNIDAYLAASSLLDGSIPLLLLLPFPFPFLLLWFWTMCLKKKIC